MSALPTRIEKEAGRPLTPLQIFDITASRETTLSRLLMLYISTGFLFMLLSGTFLGVWNLLAISSHHAADSVSAGWIQAHGHAQIFGWIGTFILGIDFYSIPKLRRLNSFALSVVWSSWALWTTGVTLRWLTSVYQWQWRTLLPLSAALELAAFAIFFRTVSGHRPQDSDKSKLEEWVFVVIAGVGGSTPDPSGQLWNCIASRHSRNIARNTSRIRSTLSRSSDLGILSPLCVGLQREMASCLSRTSASARTSFTACGRYKFRRGLDCLRRLDDGCKPLTGHGFHHGGVLATIA